MSLNLDKISFDECRCSKNKNTGRIPVSRVIEKLDGFFAKNDMDGAGKLLEYWHGEAVALGDLSGELSVVNEELGYFRKLGDHEKGLASVERSLELIELTGISRQISSATVMLNAATTLKAFGKAETAVKLYDCVYDVYTKELDAGDLRFGAYYNNKALALTDLSRFDEAEECYQKALAVVKNSKDGLADCAVTYINMAHLNDTRGFEAEAAESCLQKAKEILDGEKIERNSYYAFVCTKCAPSYDYFGFFAYANELKERAKTIYERA